MQLNSGRQMTLQKAAYHANRELDDIRLHLAPLCNSPLLRITEEENVEVSGDYNTPRGNITTRYMYRLDQFTAHSQAVHEPASYRLQIRTAENQTLVSS